jgi:hypothetical protein
MADDRLARQSSGIRKMLFITPQHLAQAALQISGLLLVESEHLQQMIQSGTNHPSITTDSRTLTLRQGLIEKLLHE